MRSAVHRPLCRVTVIMRRSPTTKSSTFRPGGSMMWVCPSSTMKVSRISTSVPMILVLPVVLGPDASGCRQRRALPGGGFAGTVRTTCTTVGMTAIKGRRCIQRLGTSKTTHPMIHAVSSRPEETTSTKRHLPEGR